VFLQRDDPRRDGSAPGLRAPAPGQELPGTVGRLLAAPQGPVMCSWTA